MAFLVCRNTMHHTNLIAGKSELRKSGSSLNPYSNNSPTKFRCSSNSSSSVVDLSRLLRIVLGRRILRHRNALVRPYPTRRRTTPGEVLPIALRDHLSRIRGLEWPHLQPLSAQVAVRR